VPWHCGRGSVRLVTSLGEAAAHPDITLSWSRKHYFIRMERDHTSKATITVELHVTVARNMSDWKWSHLEIVHLVTTAQSEHGS